LRGYNIGFRYWAIVPEGKVQAVKEKIHPKYVESTVHCACGETWKTRSTTPQIHVEICSQCHPFFTGKQKLIDTAGRVERFNKKYGKSAPKQEAKAEQ